MDEVTQDTGSGSLEQLSKGLIRYALSCEHSRKPIKRQDINEKGRTEYMSQPRKTNTSSTRVAYTPVQGGLQSSTE
jgi:hypothetical protein